MQLRQCCSTLPSVAEEVTTTEALLPIALLPLVIDVGEEYALSTARAHDAIDSLLLVISTGASSPVARSCARPSGLEVDTLLTRAKLLNCSKFLVANKITGARGIDSTVEKGVDIGTHDVNDLTDQILVILQRVKRLRRCAWAGVACSGKCGLAAFDEINEINSLAVATEDTFVTNDDQLDQRPLAPGNDISDLALGGGDARLVNEDTNNHLKADS